MSFAWRLLVAAILALGAAVACSDGFTRDEAVDAFVEANDDASRNEAGCVIDRLAAVTEEGPVDDDDLAGLEAELEATTPSPAFARAQVTAMFACGLTRSVEAELVRLFEQRSDTSPHARCLASELVATMSEAELLLLIDGSSTGDSFFPTFFDAAEACGMVTSGS